MTLDAPVKCSSVEHHEGGCTTVRLVALPSGQVWGGEMVLRMSSDSPVFAPGVLYAVTVTSAT